ncbi:MAG: sulfite exporter TauE/SafE family protein [Candidatus Omnitrophica bacterium]|jgi:ABC-type nickel/cobalt efflux system permease component RcnA|nr:sulfite exporter TauE/SafE family protein [Candidatus Omnitrophota bacterium]
MGSLIFLQLFGLGLSFGFTGPCFFSCVPFLVTYLAGRNLQWKQGLKEALIFFCARLLAYLALGLLAGLSAALLKRFNASGFIFFLKPIGGLIVIALGALILLNKGQFCCSCKFPVNKTFTFGSLFILGFIAGISPCAPLMALLFEITIISKGALEGALCAFSFGLGTFVSGFIIIAVLSRTISWFPLRLLKSELSLFVFRVICSLFLILLGLSFLLP